MYNHTFIDGYCITSQAYKVFYIGKETKAVVAQFQKVNPTRNILVDYEEN